jgi:DNA polymerase I-like protein with 3'-5' exonuclease and polymerase domains
MTNIKFITTRDLPDVSFEKVDLQDVTLPQDCCLDLETTGLVFNRDKILLVVLGNKNVQYVVDYLFVDKELLKKKLANVRTFLGHNLSFDLPFLINEGFKFSTDQIYDSLEAELTLVKGTKESVSLLNTTKRRLGIAPYDKGLTILFTYLSKDYPLFTDSLIEYAATDILHLEDIREEQMRFIKKYGQEKLTRYNNGLVVVTSYMKVRGIKVDDKKWLELYYKNLRRGDELEVLLDEELSKVGLKQKKRTVQRTLQLDLLGGAIDVRNKNVVNINYSSPSQIVEIFRQLNLPIPKSAKEDKNSIGRATLQQYLITNPQTPLKTFIEHLLEYKEVSKRGSAFGKKWLEENVDSDGKVRATLKINRTTTGRFSSSDPNLQQIPSSQDYRDCFVASDGYVIWGADYSGAELKILASLSKDDKMLELLSTGADLHGYAATQVLRYLKNDNSLVVDKNNNKDFRGKMKNVIFGLVYGASSNKISELLDISKDKGEKVYELLKKIFPQAFGYLETVANFGVSNGYVVANNVFNQRRWFPEASSGKLTKSQSSAIERYSKNTPIQGTNANMMKLALVEMFDFIEVNQIDAHILMTIHDEVLVEINKNEQVEIIAEKLKGIMLYSADRFLDGIKMEVEDYIGYHWTK